MLKIVFISILILFTTQGCQEQVRMQDSSNTTKNTPEDSLPKSEQEWKEKLTSEQYHILREKGTERAFTGKYWNLDEEGIYRCAGCGIDLFRSDEKFESGCGWPSFWEAADSSKIVITKDYSYGMIREEVTCKKCGGHLGHVFDDGPQPTGLRYCINSGSLNFEKKKK